MTQPNLNELIARAMGEEPEYVCHWCGDIKSKKLHRVCNAPDGDGHLYKPVCPDFEHDANHAERAAAWLAGRKGIKNAWHNWKWKQFIVMPVRGEAEMFNGEFKPAICAAFAWWLEREEG